MHVFLQVMDSNAKDKVIGNWLLVGVAMMVGQVLLGGVTRLTGSGLSITEWQPILGAIPPLTSQGWSEAFELYQQKTSQYKYLNQDFSLSDFKFIYFWEWFHRLWARLIAVAFVIPFVYFLAKKYLSRKVVVILLSLFASGIGIGLIGWIMVKSGLNNDNVYVSHINLAYHFLSAMLLIGCTYWFALTLRKGSEPKISNPSLRLLHILALLLLFFQMMYGAFMAGKKAAKSAPTWPDINGSFIPEGFFVESMFHDTFSIHFIHRMLAYLLLGFIVYLSIKIKKIKSNAFDSFKWAPLLWVFIQVILGILSLLYANTTVRNGFGAFEYLAQAHQLVAMFLMLSLLRNLFFLKKTANNQL